ncbi:GNAT family N-acetyltransferase [Cellulomonas sp.]|uniref:GNAT family N-acetyltransferase n=1 Tax=Cellulomonas sp. TaxID=40001 RepID=UPI0028117F9C|nr:GNAT family N-acetyltransferase [Cellulomonas sp.]
MHEHERPAPLRLTALGPHDESAAWAAHDEIAREGFEFLPRAERGGDWAAYLRRLEDERTGADLPAGRVPATFLVADVAGVVVGRVSVRHTLNDHLSVVGGHIGYVVLPAYRRRGYATAMLRESLVVARSAGVHRALVTCDDENVASIRTIERCGGVLEDVVHVPGAPGARRRYRVATDGRS